MEKPSYDKSGLEPRECFFKYDQTGVLDPCTDPEVVFKVLRFKKSLNFWIKTWIDGYMDMMEPIEFYISQFDNPPEWVEKSFRHQLQKRYNEEDWRQFLRNLKGLW